MSVSRRVRFGIVLGALTTTASDGSIADLQTVAGGIGGLAGASGFLRAQGTFTFPTGGSSHYIGTVCLR
jgi:hypothetical protein